MTSPLARVRFLARLAACEAAIDIADWASLERLVREASPYALEIEDPDLLARFDAAFMFTDPQAR